MPVERKSLPRIVGGKRVVTPTNVEAVVPEVVEVAPTPRTRKPRAPAKNSKRTPSTPE